MSFATLPTEIVLYILEGLVLDNVDGILPGTDTESLWNASEAISLVCRDWKEKVDSITSQIYRVPVVGARHTYTSRGQILGLLVHFIVCSRVNVSVLSYAGHPDDLAHGGPYIAIHYWHTRWQLCVASYRSKLDNVTQMVVGGWDRFRRSEGRHDIQVLREYLALPSIKYKRRLGYMVFFDVILQTHVKMMFAAAEIIVTSLEIFETLLRFGGSDRITPEIIKEQFTTGLDLVEQWSNPNMYSTDALNACVKGSTPDYFSSEVDREKLEHDLSTVLRNPDIPYLISEVVVMSGIRAPIKGLSMSHVEETFSEAARRAKAFCRRFDDGKSCT
ncbi:hypothetical protein PUNSTDRAFT_144622 [Punctularia strigosozonata HHB-11173 SS5]|uniref:uncharacterized protein n=1 Tax=Punctularia strigosozonata (strain HHB-11173) TaxID=741275 RepID=UPI0004417693|nr:uncharacterized protein PUNSTDRAFT_144622 [Punctularia strigosozonata HHB-11173 SS5]EIN07057.1 hypothetical protein PUNSTDRAFT_144622 [Punctularia strigosozonata HHB-11173 SS5]